MIDLKKLAEDLKLNEEQRKIIKEKYSKEQFNDIEKDIEDLLRDIRIYKAQYEEKIKIYSNKLLRELFLNMNKSHYYFIHSSISKCPKLIIKDNKLTFESLFITKEDEIYAKVYPENEDSGYAIPLFELDSKNIEIILNLLDEDLRNQSQIKPKYCCEHYWNGDKAKSLY